MNTQLRVPPEGLTETFWIFVVAGAALVASPSGEVGQTGTLAVGCANGRHGTDFGAGTRPTVRVAVEARTALVAADTVVARFAQTLAHFLVANLRHRTARVAVTIYQSIH